MALAEFHEVLPIDKDKLFATIVAYNDYPKFVEGCTSTQVERKGPTEALVTYNITMVKDITYTLEHREDQAAGRVDWKLVNSDFVKMNSGTWLLKSVGPGKTDVHYKIEIDFKVPVPGFILNRIVKAGLPKMVKSFAERAKSV